MNTTISTIQNSEESMIYSKKLAKDFQEELLTEAAWL